MSRKIGVHLYQNGGRRMNNTWNADQYTKEFSFAHQYGNHVLELIDAPLGSSVLDLGCGNGALTNTL
jgi:trans-aconitate methyltransferase